MGNEPSALSRVTDGISELNKLIARGSVARKDWYPLVCEFNRLVPFEIGTQIKEKKVNFLWVDFLIWLIHKSNSINFGGIP